MCWAAVSQISMQWPMWPPCIQMIRKQRSEPSSVQCAARFVVMAWPQCPALEKSKGRFSQESVSPSCATWTCRDSCWFQFILQTAPKYAGTQVLNGQAFQDMGRTLRQQIARETWQHGAPRQDRSMNFVNLDGSTEYYSLSARWVLVEY